MDIVVRTAGPEDVEDVVEVHACASEALFEESVGRPLADALPLEDRLDDGRRRIAAASATAETLVAERHGRIVGMASWRISADGEGELEDLHVRPDAWGTSVSVALLGSVVEALRDSGVSALFLWVGESNARARGFYEREGWEHDGVSRPSAFGPTELRYRLLPSSLRPSA